MCLLAEPGTIRYMIATPGVPALFLDRDGVIIKNRTDHVRSWDDVVFFPQALMALAQIRNWPGKIVIVTNQSVVGHGLISLPMANAINERLVQEIERMGGRIDAVYLCPHTSADDCQCRKPRPGMLHQAARALGIDMQRSIMIGDALTDLSAGRAAGVGQVVLVQTGRGRQQLRHAGVADMAPFLTYATLAEALQRLLYQDEVLPDRNTAS